MQNSKVRSQNITKCHFWTHFKTFSILQSYGGAKNANMPLLDQTPHKQPNPTLIHIQHHSTLLTIIKMTLLALFQHKPQFRAHKRQAKCQLWVPPSQSPNTSLWSNTPNLDNPDNTQGPTAHVPYTQITKNQLFQHETTSGHTTQISTLTNTLSVAGIPVNNDI